MINKTQITARKRGKGGTFVVLEPGTWSARYGVGPFVVKDLMDRARCNMPNEIGVGPADRGIAWGVKLSEIHSIAQDL